MESVRSVYYVCLSNSEDSVTSLQDQFNLQIEVYIKFWVSFFSFFFRSPYRLHLFVVCTKMDQQNQTIGFRTWHYKEYCLLLSLVWNNQTAAAATTWVKQNLYWIDFIFFNQSQMTSDDFKTLSVTFYQKAIENVELDATLTAKLSWKFFFFTRIKGPPNLFGSQGCSKPKLIQDPSSSETQGHPKPKLLQDLSSFKTQAHPSPNLVQYSISWSTIDLR